MPKHKEQILEELGKAVWLFYLNTRKGKSDWVIKQHKKTLMQSFSKALDKFQQATIEEIEKAFEEYKKWLAEQQKIESGAGDAVDLTANAMRMAQIERGANNVRDFILDKLKKEGG